MTSAGGHEFERAVAVQPLGRSRYGATVDPAWRGPVAPNGGVLAAIMVRAAEAELGAEGPPPRTIAAQFLSVPADGPIVVHVEVLRAGRRVTFLDVRIRQGERLAAQSTIVCSPAGEGDPMMTATAPAAARPGEVQAIPVPIVPGRPPIFDRLEMRPVFGPRPLSGADRALTGGWLALRDDDAPLDAARLCAMTDLWWPAMFGVMQDLALVPTVQLTVHLRSTAPGVRGPVLARFETRSGLEGHSDEIGELWSADGMLLAESRQLALRG